MIIVRFQKSFPLRVSEWCLAAILFTFGAILLSEPTVFANSPAMSKLAALASQELWGWACALVGLIRLIALGINGAWRSSPHVRAGMAFLSCFLWLQIVFGLFGSGVPNTGLAVYPWLLSLDVWNVFRASADARIADDRARTTKA